MTAFARPSADSFQQKLIALLEDGRDRNAVARSRDFSVRLDALEVEAVEHCAPDSTLTMIRVAREAVQFAERIGARAPAASG